MEHTWQGVEAEFANLRAELTKSFKGDKGDAGEKGDKGDKGDPGVTTVVHKMHDAPAPTETPNEPQS